MGMSRAIPVRIAVVVLLIATVVGTAAPAAKAQADVAPYVPAGLVEIERGGRSLDEIAAGFPARTEAAALLRAWGWAANAYYNHAGETANGTTSLEVSLHLFADAPSATEALSYFAAGRALVVGLDPVPIGRIGDDVLAIGGRRDGVNEVTIYVRAGAFLVRVSAVAPSGDPFPDADATAAQFLVGVQGDPGRASSRTVDQLLPGLYDLPTGFVVSDEGARGREAIAGTFLRPGEADAVLRSLGFEENVYRYFERPARLSPYPGAASSVEVSLHLFDGISGAFDALPYYADGRAEALGIRVAGYYDIGDGAIVLLGAAPGGGVESTVYLLVGNVLARITAVAPDGDPTADALSAAFVVAGRA